MAPEKELLIQQLNQVISLLESNKKEEDLTLKDREVFSFAIQQFGKKYKFSNSYPNFLKRLSITNISNYIDSLIKEDIQIEKEKGVKKETPKEQESSIPPELESLVAEYQKNQDLLNSDEIKNNQQRSVAEQVKIAIAHSKNKELALANKQRQISQGKKYKDIDTTIVSLGSPRSTSIDQAFSKSYEVIKEIAFSDERFKSLSPEAQVRIISQAVELNTASVTNLFVAIESATLLIETSDLSEVDQKTISDLPSKYVHSVYDAINTKTQQSATYASQIEENEIVLLQFKKESQLLSGKDLEIKKLQINSLVDSNKKLDKKIDSLTKQFDIFVNNQSQSFNEYKENSTKRLSVDPDLDEKIKIANTSINAVHKTLEKNGIKPHIYTPVEDSHLLEQAIRKDLPGSLRLNSGYNSEELAAILRQSKTLDPKISPEAVLLYGKDLNPELLAQVRKIALENPNSPSGILYKNRKDIFDSIGSQIRNIHNSPVGKDIKVIKTGLAKIFAPITDSLGKLSDKIGGYKTVFSIVQNPWGTLKSWAGRKAGEQIGKRLSMKIGNAVLYQAGEVFLKKGLKAGITKLAKEAIKKMVIKGVTWAATKIGISIAAESLNAIAPGIGILIDIAIQALIFVAEKTFVAAKEIAKSIYGEEIKTRDLLIMPVAAVGTAIGGFFAFISAVGTATVAAASSAVGIASAGIALGIFFYITSIAVAPLISTLVQLDSTPSSFYSGPILPGCPSTWPVGAGHPITQGPGGFFSHYSPGYDQAIDIGTPIGTSIQSTTYGVVTFAGFSTEYMNTDIVVVDSFLEDGTTFKVVYAHLSSISVAQGGSVEIGTVIGTTGIAGSGAHLHYEYKGISYNQCPAGGVQIAENCGANQYPGTNSCTSSPQVYTN